MVDKNDLVSVIIRTKDRPFLLKRAIDSVCSQDYKNIEIIIVNDGGIDVSDIVNYYESKNSQINYKYVNNKVSVLRSKAANIGISVAKGKYLCLLDDDDYFLQQHVSKHVAVQEKNKCLWSVSKTIESVENSDGLEIKKGPGKVYDFNELKFLFFENYFPSNSVVFQKSLIKKVGEFDKSLQVLEDWDIWVRMYLETKPVFIDDVTSVYTTRNGENNVRTSVRSREIWNDCFIKIMEKYKNGSYKFNDSDTYLIDAVKFLPDHSERWYKINEENKELKDSWAFKIYLSDFYKIIKKGLKFRYS